MKKSGFQSLKHSIITYPWNSGVKIASRSKFNSIPIHDLCLEIVTYSINKAFLMRMREVCPSFKL